MTGNKQLQQIQRRLDKLGKLFPIKPLPSREDLIVEMAFGFLSDEQLWIVERMEGAGRVIPSNEEELEALAAHEEAFERATKVIDTSSNEEIRRLIDEDGTFPKSTPTQHS